MLAGLAFAGGLRGLAPALRVQLRTGRSVDPHHVAVLPRDVVRSRRDRAGQEPRRRVVGRRPQAPGEAPSEISPGAGEMVSPVVEPSATEVSPQELIRARAGRARSRVEVTGEHNAPSTPAPDDYALPARRSSSPATETPRSCTEDDRRAPGGDRGRPRSQRRRQVDAVQHGCRRRGADERPRDARRRRRLGAASVRGNTTRPDARPRSAWCVPRAHGGREPSHGAPGSRAARARVREVPCVA